MRRGTITVLVVVALLALIPGMALARNVACNAGADLCRGTNESDRIRGSLDDDVIQALNGADTVNGRAGTDEVFGGGGNDRISDLAGDDQDEVEGGGANDVINVRDGDEGVLDPVDNVIVDDEVVCGGGRDRVISDAVDDVDPDTCEVGGDVEPEEPEVPEL